MFDAAYDAEHNLVIVSGNESMSWSGALTARETWTYRYRLAEPKRVQERLDLKVTTADDGTATLTWKTRSSEGLTGYSVLRKRAGNSLAGDWEPIAQVPAEVGRYVDSSLPEKGLFFYSLRDQRGDRTDGFPSTPVRTVPSCIRWATAVLVEDGVRVSWQPSRAEDVVGYHLYRARADLRWPWHDLFDPARQAGDFVRITSEPVYGSQYLDEAVKGEEASELYWPQTFAYVIRAVNHWGLEGGPSPVSLALADPPGAVRVIPWLDGRRLVLWTPPRTGKDVRGYHIMRMDDWHRDYVFRWQAAPLISTAFFDSETFPRADRRRYYVSAVDVYGTVGIPSSGVWSHGLP
jgi:hypothetical protein